MPAQHVARDQRTAAAPVGRRRGDGLPRAMQLVGLALALAGLVGLVLPGLSAPPLVGSLLMAAAGIAWGVYSLRGRGAGDPVRVNAGNFARAVPFALALSAATFARAIPDATRLAYAAASGALPSRPRPAIRHAALPPLAATPAATSPPSAPARPPIR